MALRLRASPSPPAYSFENADPGSSSAISTSSNQPSPPTAWLPPSEMSVLGAIPLRNTSDIGIVICKECSKPLLRSAAADHAATCLDIRAGKKGVKAKLEESAGKGLKRKAEEPEPETAPKNKKAKAAANAKNPPKARVKGPVDLDRHCGVINDKGLPCSRSLTCKSHSMGAKRAVEGRSRKYDDLLLDWQRENNPNFVEPVKRETKKERLEKKAAEKKERKRQEMEELARKKGIDLNEPGAEAKLEQLKQSTKKKKAPAVATTTNATTATARRPDEPPAEDLAELDSEEELESIAKSLRAANDRGMLGTPLAHAYDTGSWFVARRERLRNCKDLFAASLMNGPGAKGASAVSAIATVTAATRMSVSA